MLSNIVKNSLLSRGKSTLFKRYNVSQIAHSVRSKSDTVSSKDQNTALETEDDDIEQPIKYSTSKAATMRIDEYRDPLGDRYPWYQGPIVTLSLAVFLGYFCILREENDIDLSLYDDLGDTLKKCEQKNAKSKSK